MSPELIGSPQALSRSPEKLIESIPIPFENRIAELGLNNGFIDEWMSIGDLVAKIDTGNSIETDKRVVRRQLIELGVPNMVDESKGKNFFLYPPKTLELLICERQWREEYLRLPYYVVLDDIADFVGRSRGWSEKTLSEHDIEPVYRRWGERLVGVYNKKAIKLLRNINLQTPLDNGWYNLGAISANTAEDREWIQNRIEEAGLISEERRSSITGKVSIHFPPVVIGVIERARQLRADAGGAWLTEAAISSMVSTSGSWVHNRLSSQYGYLSEKRQDDHGVTRQHYPPWVFEEIKKDALNHTNYPPIERHLPISVVAKKVGHHVLWVTNRLAFIGAEPKLRRDGQNRIIECYSPHVPRQLLELPPDIIQRFRDIEPWFE